MKEKSQKEIDILVERYPSLSSCKIEIIKACELLINTFLSGNKLLVCGNGGSASDSEHIVGELMKGFCKKRPLPIEMKDKLEDEELYSYLQGALPTIALTVENALTTAFSNDQNPAFAFAQQVYGLGVKGDALLTISTSGNSKNCIYAAKVARAKGVKVIALTGANESKLSELADITIKAPEKETYKIQEYHLPIYHAICLAIENEFFEE